MTNFYQPVLVKIYRDPAIMEAWLSFHDVLCRTSDQNCEARVLNVLGAIASTCPPHKDNTKHSSQQDTWNNNMNIKACSVPSGRSTSIKRDRCSYALLTWPVHVVSGSSLGTRLTWQHNILKSDIRAYIQYPVPLQ